MPANPLTELVVKTLLGLVVADRIAYTVAQFTDYKYATDDWFAAMIGGMVAAIVGSQVVKHRKKKDKDCND